jgi:hypothetical protein
VRHVDVSETARMGCNIIVIVHRPGVGDANTSDLHAKQRPAVQRGVKVQII